MEEGLTNCDDHVDQTIKVKEPAQGNSGKFSTETVSGVRKHIITRSCILCAKQYH